MHVPVEMSDIVAFFRVAETGGFARAAERMGIDKSIVSRRVTRLEQTLGAKLMTRGPSGTTMTEIGEAYYARVSNGLHEIEAAREAVASAITQVSGPVRITAPVSFGIAHLADALVRFATDHPRVELDIAFDDKMVDLARGGFDLAIRIGNLPDSSLVARRLAPVRMVALASPDYLAEHGRPVHPRDLADHHALVYANAGSADPWRFKVGDGWEKVRGKPRLRADNGDMLRAAACAGMGIVLLPTFIAAPAIGSGALEILLRDFPVEDSALHAVMPPGRAATARIRALVDFLAKRFGGEPSWDPCWLAERAASAAPTTDAQA